MVSKERRKRKGFKKSQNNYRKIWFEEVLINIKEQ